jgi:hypothetical protein
MELDETVRRFTQLANLTAEEAAPWQTLCSDCLVRVRSQCRAEVDWSAQSDVLCDAASALAFYRYALCCASNEGGSWTVGDVKVQDSGQQVAAAKALWQEAERQIAPLLQNSLFYFGIVGRDMR